MGAIESEKKRWKKRSERVRMSVNIHDLCVPQTQTDLEVGEEE